jgi:hypothetical protein
LRRARHPAALAAALVAAGGLVVGGAWAVFRRVVWEAPGGERAVPVALSTAGPVSGPARAEIRALRGVVERGRDGGWAPAAPGDVLAPDEALRTGPASSAALAFATGAILHLDESTEVVVLGATPAREAIRLERGRVAADAAPGTPGLRVEARGGIAAEGRGARFTVVAGAGGLAVATETGTVELSTPSATVEVGARARASASPGSPPTPAAPISAEVVLRVAAARGGAVGARCPVSGWVEPGTEVRVDGVLVPVSAAGRFEARAPVPASGIVRVWARDVAGRAAERQVACRATRPAPAPVTDFSVRWGRDGR